MSHVPLELIVARDDQTNDIVGVMWLQRLGTTPYYFIPYYAIDRIHQGCGIGHILFGCVLEYLASKPDIEAIIWEIEVPDEQTNDNRNRRLHYYEKMGGQVVTYAKHFRSPNINDYGEEPLWLMVAPVGNHPIENDLRHAWLWVDALLTYDIDYQHYPEHREKILNEMTSQLA